MIKYKIILLIRLISENLFPEEKKYIHIIPNFQIIYDTTRPFEKKKNKFN